MPEKKLAMTGLRKRANLPKDETFHNVFFAVAGKITGFFSVQKILRLPLVELVWLTVFFLLPLVYWPFSYTSFELPKTVFFRIATAVLIGAWLLRAREVGKLKCARLKQYKWQLMLVGLMIVTWILSTVLAAAPAVSVFGFYPRFAGLYTWLSVLIFAAIVFFSLENRQQLERIFAAIRGSAFVVCLLAILQSYGLSWLNYWDISTFLGRYFGTLGHPDYLAAWLVAVIPLLVAAIFEKKKKIFAAVTLVLALTVLYMTLSRSAYLGLFAGLLVFILVAAKKTGMHKFYRLAVSVPVLFGLIFAFAQIYADSDFVRGNALLSRMTLQGENLRSIETRLNLWPASAAQIMERPWYGYGLDNMAITFPKFAPAALNTLENLGDYSDRAHNLLLDYGLQLGLPALAIFLAFIFAVFAAGIRNIFRKDKEWKEELGILSGLAALLTANLFGFFVITTWVYFWVLIALLWRMQARAETEINLQFLQRKYAGGIFAALVIICLVPLPAVADISLISSDVAYRDYVLGGNPARITAATAGSPEISLYAVVAANLHAPDSAAFAEQAGKITAFEGPYEFTVAKLMAAAGNSEAAPHFEKAIQQSPTNPFIYLEYGKFLLSSKKPENAAAMFEKMLTVSPDYYTWRENLSSRSPQDQEKYRIFYKLNPDFNNVFALLVDAYRKTGNTEKAHYYEQYLYY